MGKEIRWLNEAKTPQEEVNNEDQKFNNQLGKALIKYKRANNIDQKGEAVAEALDSVVGFSVGSNLKKSLGPGMLTRFMEAFKWGSLTENNLFIQLLKRIFGSNDGKPIKDILTKGKATTVSRSELEKQATQTTESLNEAENDYTLSDAAVDNLDNTAQPEVETPEQPQPEVQIDAKTGDQAKLFNMSSRDLFMVLYNGYLDHAYDGEDLYNIDNDPDDQDLVKSSDGNYYRLSKSISNIFNKCYNNEDAFTYKDEKNNNQVSNNYNRNNRNRSNYRDVQDAKDKILKASRAGALTKEDRAELIREISDHSTR